MGKPFFRRVISCITSGLLLLTSLPLSGAFALEDTETESYVPFSEIARVSADSYQAGYEPEKAFDGIEGDPNNCWHTPWDSNMTDFPHWIMAEFETPQYIDALVYVPRGAQGYPFVTKYEVWISPDDNEENLQKVTEGTWEQAARGVATFPVQKAQLVRFVLLEKNVSVDYPDDTSISASEIKVRLSKDAVITQPERYVPASAIGSVAADSYQAGYEPEKAFDGLEGDPNNCWHTPWDSNMTDFPHWIMAEFKTPQYIDGLVYVPRGAVGYPFVTKYEVWISPDTDPDNLEKAAEGTWEPGFSGVATFPAQKAQLVRFVLLEKNVSADYPDDTSISASEIKIRLNMDMPGAYDDDILKTVGRAENVLAYAQDLLGDAEHQMDRSLYDALASDAKALEALVGTGNAQDILWQISRVEDGITALLGSNKAEEESLFLDIPHSMMTVSANSSNAGYAPENAIDGNTGTMWHSMWSPTNDPFPHIFTIDLHKRMILKEIRILPRQDADAGKISKGQIYAGDSPDDMALVTEFTAESGRGETVVDLQFVTARYVQIYSLEATSANTAISEINLSTYDRAVAGAFIQYEDAQGLLRAASVGSNVGEYAAADVLAFEKVLQGFGDRLNQEDMAMEAYYALMEDMAAACQDFVLQAKAYTKEDLAALIHDLEACIEGITNPADQQNAAALLDKAERLHENPDAQREELHDCCVEMNDFMKAVHAADENSFDLSGEWGLTLSGYDGDTQPESRVTLPGTLDTNKEGKYNALADIARLSRYYTYTGPAAYQKNLYISEEWAGKNITLYMERTRQTRVWVNGTEILAPDSSNILPVAQQYDITGAIRFGEYNTIVIQVDNSYEGLPQNGIRASHMATDETQTNWNGIVGTFKLQAREKAYIDDLRVYPNDDLQSVKIEADVRNSGDEAYTGALTFSCPEAGEREIDVSLDAGETKTFTLSDYAMPADVKLWSEFDRPLYDMTAELGSGDKVTETFGMRTFKSEDSSFTINGDKVFLRSEANCAVFPLTGYAPMDEAGWEKLFSTYQSYGINAVRFHSWCPPDAAFRVADRLGMYLQPELSCWAGGMLGDQSNRTYYTKEAFAIIKEYANHPSFVMLSFGNELGYNGNDYLEQGDKLVQALQAQDPTRLYAPGSNVHFGSLDPTPNADFYTAERYLTANLRGSYGGLNGFFNQSYPSGAVDYDQAMEMIGSFGVPVFGFEVGQYQIFPDVLTEPEQYTGVLEARNLQTVLERLEDKGYTEEDIRKAIEASGMLSRLGYKAEIEAALRTEGMDGISLLGIQDFSGQGTALVGMMNAFGDSKPYDFADPDAFSAFFSPVVPLLEIEKFVWTNDQTLTGTIKLSNYGPDDLEEAISYTLTDKDGKVFYEGKTDTVLFQQGSLTEAGTLSVPLDGIEEPTQFKLEITCADGQNSYNLWVYPAGDAASEGEVYVTAYLDELALQLLEEGGKVFLSPSASTDALPQSREGRFSTAFWSTNDQTQPGTMGLLMDPEHPLFANFPTDFHSDYQWWAMSKLGRPMVLDGVQDENGNIVQPLITVIDGAFGKQERLGLLYEAAIGEGKLMVSSMGLEQLQNEYPEAKALRNAILDYMNSDAFNPTFQAEVEDIKAQVQGIQGSEENNLASQQNGGRAFLGANTETCQGGYDNRYTDRLLEINDGIVDLSSGARSWTDFNNGVYPNDVEIGVELAEEYTVDSVAFSFFEDAGCKAPASVRVKYWNGEKYISVSRQNKLDGFEAGMNTITFAPVQTDRLLFVMEHVDGMAVAISEMFVYEKQVDPESIQIRTEGDVQTVALNQTLQLYIDTQPDYANNRNVKWTVEDENGNPSELARVGFDGVLRPSGVGKIVVKASLRSDPTITASLELEITESKPVVKGDLDKDGEVTIADVMEACKVMAREAAGTDSTDDEIARGDLDGDGEITIADVMEICKILARQG